MTANTGTAEIAMELLAHDALLTVNGPRRGEYGNAKESFEAIAKIWSGILGWNVSGKEVALCMAGLKLYRESYQGKRDNRLDAIGYMLLIEDMQAEADREAEALVREANA